MIEKEYSLQFSLPKLKNADVLRYAKNLSKLVITDSSLREVPPIGDLPKLRNVELEKCSLLQDISALCPGTSIESVSLVESIYIKSLEPLLELPNLQSLKTAGFLSEVVFPTDLPGTEELIGKLGEDWSRES